jgi:hypothetical protein
MEDKRNVLRDEQPFDYKILKDNKAHIFFGNKVIKIVIGKEYEKLIKKIDENDYYDLQLFMAKITGHFKHGNEKQNRKR